MAKNIICIRSKHENTRNNTENIFMHFYNRCCNLVTGYSLFILLSLHQLE